MGGSDNISLEEEKNQCVNEGWMGDVHEWERVRESVEECRTVSVCIVFEIEQEKCTRNFFVGQWIFLFLTLFCVY